MQRHRWPESTSRTCASSGLGLAASSSATDIRMPGVQ
ncbi:Uncharacterised protein [Bordetella pertussis]|nr:Uncharacterised protein [Bordetella pertussis]